MQNNNKLFEDKENIGRNYFTKNFSGKGKFEPAGLCDRYDISVTGETNKIYKIEIKVRDMDSTAYDDYIIEIHKAKYLMNLIENSGVTKCYYVNYFNDNVVLIWHINKKLIKKSRMEERTKYKKNVLKGKKEIVPVIFLNVKDAKKRQYKK